MSKSGRSLMVALLCISVFAANVAEAARLGGGRSFGMQRSQITRSAPVQPAPSYQQAPQPAQQPQRSGPGWGGVAAGVAAGAATGYLASKMMEPGAASASSVAQTGPVGQSQGGGIPWGWILLLGGIALLGARMMTRRASQVISPAQYGSAGGAAFDPQNGERKVFRMGDGMSAAPVGNVSGRLPDGTETAPFLRQARASFQHIQSLNSPDQMEEVRKYLTPELFEELKAEIGMNRDVAEFHDLQADLLDSSHEQGRLVASVRFSGRVSENLNAPALPFAEVWHFVHPSETDPRWVLAGIEQV
ncbi:MAG: Tim44-like domain-containing protein [Formivibrio sp.]|nr:Tim44-like domain-containing protein [Formivibrio sp.]